MKNLKLLFITIYFVLFHRFFLGTKINALPRFEGDPAITNDFQQQEVTEYWTQHFFDLLRPELKGKPVPAYETIYQKEKAAIEQVVNYVLLSGCQHTGNNGFYLLTQKRQYPVRRRSIETYPRYRYNPRGFNKYIYNRERSYRYGYNSDRGFFLDEKVTWEDYHWRHVQNYLFDGLYADLTDAIFYARYPEVPLHESKLRHMNYGANWNMIRRHFANYNQEEILKKYFIPVCDVYR